MVSAKTWFSLMGGKIKTQKTVIIGILSFEVAKSMARIVSLHESLTNSEISKLRIETIRSPGIQYLTSQDESFLLELACRELLEDLACVASNVSRLGIRCKNPALRSFNRVYSDLVRARIDFMGLGLFFGEKEMARKIKKMEKLIVSTSNLYSALEVLNELEVSDRKLQQWKSYSGPLRVEKPNSDLFQQKLSLQKQYVKSLRDSSLWNQSYDKIVGLMARFVCTIYMRICLVFAPAHLLGLPQLHFSPTSDGNGLKKCQNLSPMQMASNRLSGPLDRNLIVIGRSGPVSPRGVSQLSLDGKELSASQTVSMLPNSEFKHQNLPANGRISERRSSCDYGSFLKQSQPSQAYSRGLFSKNFEWKDRITHAPPSTVGGSGLALRYSNLIVIVEKLLQFPNLLDDDARDDLYQMLPTKLRMSIRGKLKDFVKNLNFLAYDALLAMDWKDAMERILGWLAPLAHAMIRWQSKQNLEKQNFDSRTNVLLLQTLYFSDKEKTEAAIVEILVALTCICHYRLMHPKSNI